MKIIPAVVFAALLAAACGKPQPTVENKDAAPAVGGQVVATPPGKIDANPMNGASQIRAAQEAAKTANGAVQQEQKQDVPAQ